MLQPFVPLGFPWIEYAPALPKLAHRAILNSCLEWSLSGDCVAKVSQWPSTANNRQ